MSRGINQDSDWAQERNRRFGRRTFRASSDRVCAESLILQVFWDACKCPREDWAFGMASSIELQREFVRSGTGMRTGVS